MESSSGFILTKGEEVANNVKAETTWLTEGIRRQLSPQALWNPGEKSEAEKSDKSSQLSIGS